VIFQNDFNAEATEGFAEERRDDALLGDLCGNLRDLCGDS